VVLLSVESESGRIRSPIGLLKLTQARDVVPEPLSSP
jgi:hypothetical protein